MVQLSPNVDPLDRRFKIKTAQKENAKTWTENDAHQREQRSGREQTTTFQAREEQSSSTTDTCSRRERVATFDKAEDRYCANFFKLCTKV